MINHASSERLKVYVHQGISATSIKHIVESVLGGYESIDLI